MYKRTTDKIKLKKFINYTPNKTIDNIIRETVN